MPDKDNLWQVESHGGEAGGAPRRPEGGQQAGGSPAERNTGADIEAGYGV